MIFTAWLSSSLPPQRSSSSKSERPSRNSITKYHAPSGLPGAGRSIAGALLFGFIGAELAKPLMRYRLPPNDRFATVLPFSIAIGRIGCLLAGCCLGEPWNGPWAVRAADGEDEDAERF